MLRLSRAFSGFSVDDLTKARDFYANTLGVDVSDGEMGTLRLGLGGGTSVYVYPKKTTSRPRTPS